MTRARVIQAVVLAASIVAVGTLTGCEDGNKVFVESAVLYPTSGTRSVEEIRLDRNDADVFVIPAGVPGIIRVGFESQTQYASCELNLNGSYVVPVTRVANGLFYVEQRMPAFTAGRSTRGNITCRDANAWPATTFVDTFDLVIVRSDQRMTARPVSVDFGSTGAGQVSAPRDITLTNAGSTPARVSAVILAGANPTRYRVASDRCSGVTLRPREQCRLRVVFAPLEAGQLPALLRIETARSHVAEQVVLTGTGLATGAPLLTIEPLVISFGDVEPPQGASSTVFVTNTGTAPLAIGRISLAGDRTSWFVLQGDDCSGTTLAPNTQCRVRVLFTPSEVGHQSATLEIPTNAGPGAVSIRGNGAGPSCTYPYC